MIDYKKFLNPLSKRLDILEDFSNLKTSSELEENEYPHLIRTTKQSFLDTKIHIKRLAFLEDQLEKYALIIDRETGDDKSDAVGTYNKILKDIEGMIQRINRDIDILNSPYFGKIIFDRKQINKFPANEVTSYIGKFAYFDEQTGKPFITDWRAPIANLYYRNSGPTPNVSFKSPLGVQEGALTQKRQFQIQEARIKEIYDAKSGNVAADEFLLSQLNQKVGKKLSEIVSTIQHKQNGIIREAINRLIIIQGVAGSGKTTIILHRLAYLFFTYHEQILSERSLIIAPNKVFLDYISDVLPSLGVSNIEANTYLFWAKKILGWDSRYIIHSIDTNLSSRAFKGDMKYLELLREFFDSYEAQLLKDLPLARSKIVANRYYELKRNHPHISMKERIDLALEYSFVQKQFNSQLVGSYMRGDDNREKKKKVRDYVKKKTDVYRIYLEFIKTSEIPSDIKKYSITSLKGKKYRYEDLAGLTWLHFQLHGTKDYSRDNIVVDEAQDLSFCEIYTLYMVAKNNNLTLAGDIAQSIKPPFFISDWNKVINQIQEFSETEIDNSYHQLNISYRTTIEIIEFTNRILKKSFTASYDTPKAVLRHGDDVKVLEYTSETTVLNDIELRSFIETINRQFTLGAVTTAIVCSNERHADEVFKLLNQHKEKFNIELVSYKEKDYKTGVLILPIIKAKGLEFDSVIIIDVSEQRYPQNELNIKLLYVATTRALHRLIITTHKNLISPILK